VQLITLDFETFYDSKGRYSLKSKEMNLSGYIRDERFKVHCCAIKIGKNKTKVYADPTKAFAAINWKEAAIVCHNTAFDGAILAWRYGIVPAHYYDTLAMTRGLHADVSRADLDTIGKLYGLAGKHEGALEDTNGKRELTKEVYDRLASYCANDVDLTYAIFCKQYEVFPAKELRLIDWTVRAFTCPTLKVNVPVAERALHEELRERTIFIACSGADEATLKSNPKFAAKLESFGVEVPMKISAYNGQPTHALSLSDLEFQELKEHEDRRVVRLVLGRIASKSTLFETRAKRMIDAGIDGQSLPVGLNFFGAKTGRWSGGNKLNMQNLPRLERTADGKIIESGTGMLRLSIEAPDGHDIVVADSAQIEARTIAWLADQTELLALFAAKQDVYTHMASQIYNIPPSQVTKLQRFIGKIAVLGLGYGMGWRKFQTTLALGTMGPPVEITDAEAKAIVNGYRKTNHMIVKLWKTFEFILQQMVRGVAGSFGPLEYEHETIWLPSGMGLHYPGLKATPHENGCDYSYQPYGAKKRVKIYGGKLVENVVQALARIIVSDQLLAVDDARPKFKHTIALMTHDEIVSVCPSKNSQKLLDFKFKAMRTAPEWCKTLPLNVDGGFAKRYEK